MSALRLGIVACLMFSVLLESGATAVAKGPPGDKGGATCYENWRFCIVDAQSKEVVPHRVASRDGANSKGVGVPTRSRSTYQDLCNTSRLDPQPPASDPAWLGNSSGAIYVRTCPLTKDLIPVANTFWAPGDEETVAIAVDPVVLAEQAKNALRLPDPRLAHSPAGSTWVNVYTWVWLENSWNQKTATARAGTAWARVTARPRTMLISAGGTSTSCAGPGRAWTSADGSARPTDGGCALLFSRSGTDVDLRVSVPYDISWTGSGGAGGDLGVLTTTADQPVTVLEAAAVGRS